MNHNIKAIDKDYYINYAWHIIDLIVNTTITSDKIPRDSLSWQCEHKILKMIKINTNIKQIMANSKRERIINIKNS